MIIKLSIIFLGIIVGFFCGMEGSTVGGHYCSGLSETQVKYLQSKSWLFNITKKCTWITFILGTPVGYIPMIIITVILMVLFPSVDTFIRSIPGDVFANYILIYIGPLLLTYFVGLFKGESLQTKYNVDNIEN